MILSKAKIEAYPEFHKWLAQFDQNAPVVAVPVFNAFDDLLECLESLLSTTPIQVPILLVDDCSTDERIKSIFRQYRELFPTRLFSIHKTKNEGFVLTCNLIFALAERRDTVLINSDIVLPARWLERLRDAAYRWERTATATPLTNHGTIVSVPFRNTPLDGLPGGKTLAEIDSQIEASSLCLFPDMPTAVGHCTYFRRQVLDLVGLFDPLFSPGYGEEVDFSQRAIKQGLQHVLADNLFVYHKGSRSFSADSINTQKEALKAAHEQLLRQRYPWYEKWVYEVAHSNTHPLARALEQASAAIQGRKIAIDLSYLSFRTTGTSVMALELVTALCSSVNAKKFHSTLIVRDAESERHLAFLHTIVDQIVCKADLLLPEDQLQKVEPVFDLIFRPSQLFQKDELLFMHRVARRTVVMILDFIAYSNPAYFQNYMQWKAYRKLMAASLNRVDGVAWNSEVVKADAAIYGFQLPADRNSVVLNGVNHQFHHHLPAQPASTQLSPHKFILMLGTDFLHKNRVFAINLFHHLVEQKGWDTGCLVFAGPRATSGGSQSEEAALLAEMPNLEYRVIDLGAVSEGEKQWLLANAALVLYPSSCEGFGLIPFEAAMAGTPALTTKLTSLGEVLGEQMCYLPSFDSAECVEVVWQMIHDEAMAKAQVQAILARNSLFQWENVAKAVWQLCENALKLPARVDDWSWELTLDEQPSVPPTRSWGQRMIRGVQILSKEGLPGLKKEYQQYINWKKRQNVDNDS